MSETPQKTSKYGSLIQQARKPENQKTGKPANQQTSKPADDTKIQQTFEGLEEMVNLSIRVSKRRRRHWSAEAKRLDTTLVAAITKALSEMFGEPDGDL